jgi:hypothetical protein
LCLPPTTARNPAAHDAAIALNGVAIGVLTLNVERIARMVMQQAINSMMMMLMLTCKRMLNVKISYYVDVG